MKIGPVKIDLPEDRFPLIVEYFKRSDHEEPVYISRIDGPGPVYGPPLRTIWDEAIDIRIEYPDGTYEWEMGP